MVIKNPTPRQIGLLTAIIVTFLTAVVISIFIQFSEAGVKWLQLGMMIPFIFIVVYLVVIIFIKEYIYRKIKLIYKSIRNHKLNPDESASKIDISSNIIDDVEQEVNDWIDDQANEISRLTEWQEYRRRFIGDIAHELKTPIFNIQGYLDTLIDGAVDDPKIRDKYLESAVRNVVRLNTILEGLDAISKLESGTIILEIQKFDIKVLIEEVFEDLEFKAKKKGISLEFKAGADASRMVDADRETIRQVLTNLVTNSIKYGNENGVTRVGMYDMDKNLLIEVADDGIGITEDHLEHVFDRFYRVDKSRSRKKGGGSGLGLSIVKHIIEAHNQSVNVRSSDGVGSTFGFTLKKSSN
jgi:two-component system phosphate regulon sensor histidine kinase PhoR